MFNTTSRHSKKNKNKCAVLNKDCNLFSGLYIACQSRDGDLETFFKHENQPEPQSISSTGKVRPGTKSDLLPCLERLVQDTPISCKPDATVSRPILDHMVKPQVVRTFKEYVQIQFIHYINTQLPDVKRLDVIWDQYPLTSLKQQTRECRGAGTRRRVSSSTIIPQNWVSFLRNNHNKTELFCYLAERILQIDTNEKQIYTTKLIHVLKANENDCEASEEIEPCEHEEADIRIILHAAQAARKGHKKILLRTTDTDIVVLAVAQVQYLNVDELWVAFGVRKHYRLIPIHLVANALGPDKSTALPFFHAATGCDTVSFFAGRGKRNAWKVWTVLPSITPVFISFSSQPSSITADSLKQCERFVFLLYSKTS